MSASGLSDQAIAVFQELGRFTVPTTITDMDDAVAAWRTLTEAKRWLGDACDDLANVIGKTMTEKRVTAAGVTVERSMKVSRTQWDKESLLRAVLDSRVVNEDTGELLDPTPLDKVLRVWNLGAPRVTALRERGLDPDEYATVERFDTWLLRVHGGD
jgi:hypothetical protein